MARCELLINADDLGMTPGVTDGIIAAIEHGCVGTTSAMIGDPALHETIADWSLALPNGTGEAARVWEGQRFVRHVAAESPSRPWKIDGWECRDTGIGAATQGLAGARVARVTNGSDEAVDDDPEFAMLVVLAGEVTFESEAGSARLRESSSVAIPPKLHYQLLAATPDCELLDVTLPD